MEKVKNPKVGDIVIGKYTDFDTEKIITYRGKVIFVKDDIIDILRDDGEEGSGQDYNGEELWVSRKKENGYWGGSGRSNFLYSDKITNWRQRLR